MKLLDSKYFNLITQSRYREGDEVVQAYECLFPQNTAVLFSKADPTRPICAVTIKSTLHSKRHRSILTKRPRENGKFQVLFNSDGQPLEFVITNLTHYEGERDFVKIDFLQEDVKVDWVNSKEFGINQVNEVHASQSCVIHADYRNDNRQLIVEGLTKSDGTALTVDEDEKSASAPRADKFYVNVVADAQRPEIISLLEGGSFWRWVEQFERVIDDPKPRSVAKGMGGEFEASGSFRGDIPEGALYDFPRDGSSSLSVALRAFGRELKDESPVASLSGASRGDDMDVEVRGSMHESAEERASFSSHIIAKSSVAENHMQVDVTEDEVAKSQAGILTHGAEVRVKSGTTYADYAYDVPGERMTFGISILPDLKPFDKMPHDDVMALGIERVKEILADRDSLMVKLTTIFKEDCGDCVICMDKAPTEVCVRCGHRYTCEECGKAIETKGMSCPICRSRIIMLVKESAFE